MSTERVDLDALAASIQKARNVGELGDVLDPAELLSLIAELRAARVVVERARIRMDIHGKSSIRLIYLIDEAVEAYASRYDLKSADAPTDGVTLINGMRDADNPSGRD